MWKLCVSVTFLNNGLSLALPCGFPFFRGLVFCAPMIYLLLYVITLKLLLHVETFIRNLCATALRNTFQQALRCVTKRVETCSQRSVTRPVLRSCVIRWNSCIHHHCDRRDRFISTKRFYFLWNLPRNGSSRKFQKTDLITWCNPLLKVSTWNRGLRERCDLE